MHPGAPRNFHAGSASAPTIPIVDDWPKSLAVPGGLTRPCYRVRAANSGERALRAAGTDPRPDLIMLDAVTPAIERQDVPRRLRDNLVTGNMSTILITAMVAREDEELGPELGAADYIANPVDPSGVPASVRTQPEVKQARDRLAAENDRLGRGVARRMREDPRRRNPDDRALTCLAETRQRRSS